MKKLKVFPIVLTLLFIVLSCTTMVAASTTVDLENQNLKSIKASTEQLKILNELKGSDVSIGEVLRKVFPSAISSMPVDVLKQMDETKMKWPNVDTLNGSVKEAETTSMGIR